jgi:hypothetical protein
MLQFILGKIMHTWSENMSSPGYFYILINPSIEGRIKIGKTAEDPENIVPELSSGTGVQTPFILVYKEFFINCGLAEAMVHQALEQLGYRVDQVLLDIAPWEAIKVIQDVKNKINFKENDDIHHLSLEEKSLQRLSNALLKKAESVYFGYDDHPVDYNLAKTIFMKSAEFGSAVAFKYLGDIYNYGNGCIENVDAAIDYYKQGARLGLNICHAYLGVLYWLIRKDIDNGKKCWRAYFHNLDPQLANFNDGKMIIEYISLSIQNGLPIKYKEKFMYNKSELIKIAEQKRIYYVSYKDQFIGTIVAKKYDRVIFFLEHDNTKPIKFETNLAEAK